MTFVSKHGRRTSTEDSYREVSLQRWRKCLATAVLLLHFCGALVLADSTASMTGQKDDNAPKKSPMVAIRDDAPSRLLLLKVPLPKSDLISSVQQVSASAKECQQQTSPNATVPHLVEPPKLNATTTTNVTTTKPTSRQPQYSQLLPFLNKSRNFHQCLYLDELSVEKACASTMRNHVHLRFCAQYNLGHILPSGQNCEANFLAWVREMDEAARLLACQFDKLLELYDCDTNYSVSYTCKECKRVYKQWVCAMVLPFHLEDELLKPCRSVCRLVEQMCPYFHPSVKEQYAGERVFKCIDPDIPDLESISPRSVFGLPGHCYCPHHLDAATEMLDSDATECELSRKVLRHQRQSTTTTIPATNFSTEIGGNSSAVTVTTAMNRTGSSSPPSSSGTSSSACACLWLFSLFMTLPSRTSNVFTSEPT